jgi:hypothetical protein
MQYGVHEEPRGHVEGAKSSPGATNNRAVLLTAGYPPLDLTIITTFEHKITQHLLPQVNSKL